MRKQQNKMLAHLVIILVIATFAIHKPVSNKDVDEAMVKDEPVTAVESVFIQTKREPMTVKTLKKTEEIPMCPKFTYSKDWSDDDAYLLAKIAMAEAEGESIQGKTLVILTVLNRVHSDEFPDTIEEVILQESNGVYQFSPAIPGGRWYTTEPNEDCWEAVKVVQEAIYDYSGGALYFEACDDEDNWHSRNLEFLYQEGNHRFYK